MKLKGQCWCLFSGRTFKRAGMDWGGIERVWETVSTGGRWLIADCPALFIGQSRDQETVR